jgi:ribosomal protein S18 acetylase RimI-like enzyme
MAVELRRSSELSFRELAALFTAAYEGYFVPISIDDPTFRYMVDVFDLDLHKSVVAVEHGKPIGLANLGRRRERTWLGGVGVVPENRRAGVGELLTSALIDRARAAGAREMVLEVIVENAPAIALYEKLGFVRTRELEVLSLPAGGGADEAEEIELDDALRIVGARSEAPAPWQRDDDVVANLARRDPPPGALKSNGAAVVYRADGGKVNLLRAAGESKDLVRLIHAVRTHGPITALNYTADGAVATVLRATGAEVVVRQYEMALSL